MVGSVSDSNIKMIRRKITWKKFSGVSGEVYKSALSQLQSDFWVEHKNSFCLETYIDKEKKWGFQGARLGN